MKVRKRIASLYPTVQYGNVTIETDLTWDTEIDGELTKETAANFLRISKRLDQVVGAAFESEVRSLKDHHESIIVEDFTNGQKKK